MCEDVIYLMPKISIIIPIYNVADDLSRCLDSVLSQTYADLEILLVDDGSTDASGRICDQYAKKDQRIQVIHKENGGVGSARNAGLIKAEGEYISFIDADDWLEPQMLEILFEKTIAADADVTICGAWFHTPDGRKQNRISGNNGTTVDAEKALYEYFALNHYGRALWNKLFRRSLVQDVRFDEDIHYYEDSLFLSRALLSLCEKGDTKVHYFSEPLYHYMIGRPGSSIRSYERYRTSVTSAERIRDLFRKAGNIRLASLAEFKIAFMSVNTCRQALIAGKRDEAGEYRSLAFRYLRKTLWNKDISLQDKLQVALALISPVKGVDLWLSLRNLKG